MAEPQKVPRGTFGRVWMYIRRYRLLLCISLLFGTINVALSLYLPILIGRAIDLMPEAGQVALEGIVRLLMVGIGVVALSALAGWLMNVINNRITFHVVRDLRNRAFGRIGVLPMRYLDGHPHGDIVSRVITDADQVADGLLMGFSQLYTGILTILGTLIFMLVIHPGVTVVVVVLTPLSLFVARFIASRTYHMFREQSEARAEQTSLVDEMINGVRVVQAFGREEEVNNRFAETNTCLSRASLRATFFSSLTNPATRFINAVVYAGVALAGALTVVNGGMTVGGLSGFLSYANQYTKPFNEISGVFTELQNALACAARLFELIEEEAERPDAPDARVLREAKGQVELDNVSFAYTAERPLIRGLNLSVAPGKKIAIVGPTGCGKTTLINLLMRFYDVDGGSIRVDGSDIRDLTRHSLRAGYGMVLQETWLRAGTIRENIAMGRPGATQEEIEAAAAASHAAGFIGRMPQGYDTQVGEAGGSLSQGQRQLLCIARVMLCHPPMLILDEATSSIDTRTEQKVQQAFDRLMEGRTSFVVAHRLSTIREADLILVMRDGNVIEQGTHEQLLERGGFYHTLYNSQFAP